MSFLELLCLGLIQGITEFLPVSSFGLLTVAESLMGLERRASELLEVMLHLGTMISILIVFRKDFIKLLAESFGMLLDILSNIVIYVHNRRHHDADLPYTRVVKGTWRKLAAFIWISTFPTMVIGYSARRLVTMVAASPFLPGALTLITGIFLLVTDLGQTEGKKPASEAGTDSAMWLGICQGVSVFPGVSRCALTICSGLLCGLGKKFVVKFSYIISVPAVFGAFLLERGEFSMPVMTSELSRSYIGAMVASAVFGVLLIRSLMRFTQKRKLRLFAYVNFLIGMAMLIRNFS